jgi:glycosyltransferase involved in cell wall biosynthesis
VPRRLWVVAPVYRDVPSFVALRERLLEVLAADPAMPELETWFVVADDTGGLDPEIEALHELADVLVVEPPFNLGHQRAIVFALRKLMPFVAEDDVVLTLDSDGQDRPEHVPRLFAALFDDAAGHRVVLALRTKREESLVFRVFYLLFRATFRALTGTVVRTGNFAAYSGWIARRALSHPSFDVTYSATLTNLGLPIAYVPCDRGRRYTGSSRMNFSRLALHGLGMLMPFTDRIAIRAFLAFCAALVAAMLGSIAVVATKLFSSGAIPGWATYSLLALLVLSFVALGNLVVLFVVFSQSRGISLANLEETYTWQPSKLISDGSSSTAAISSGIASAGTSSGPASRVTARSDS